MSYNINPTYQTLLLAACCYPGGGGAEQSCLDLS